MRQVINAVLDYVCLTEGIIGSQTYQVSISLVSECIVQLVIFRSGKNSHIGSFTHGMRANIVGESR